ncbi:MAG: MmcQ/YjbR family DNA-binding protein [Clostridia bacterium]|nr:MmcQ/YjbR family DNA-binding protein [Clostridia bacterium]
MTSFREEIIGYVLKKYGASPEYLWMRYPDYAVFRHADNGKWFGIVMDVKRSKLGLAGYGAVDILNVKVKDPLLADLLIKQPGYLRGYHISRGNWVSILLDGTVELCEIERLLDGSFAATASAEKKRRIRPKKEWLVPANPKYYDIEHAFDEKDEIAWKQGAGIIKGDTVFMYVAAPVKAVLYKCAVTETDIPYRFDDGRLQIRALMRIKLIKRYAPDRFTFAVLGSEYGIYAVRGPRGIPKSLSDALK